MLMSLDACSEKRHRWCLLNEVMFFYEKKKKKDFYYLPTCCLKGRACNWMKDKTDAVAGIDDDLWEQIFH